MFRTVLFSFPRSHALGYSVLLGTILMFSMVILPSSQVHAKSSRKAAPQEVEQAPVPSTVAPNPDQLLIEIYSSLAANNLQLAQFKADELTQAYPNFQLGHLIRGDLLAMHTRPVTGFGANLNTTAEKVNDFRQEAIARIKAIREKPDPQLVPRSILQLRADQKQILLVDAKRSRLYLYENDAGFPRLVSDYYVSQGKLGINKFKEGDQKTPTGVYYITSRLSGSKLPDFYGPGALPLNYPNDWDKLNGRSGSGIWLHGVPTVSFSRPPLASDGCVVLTNADFLKVASSVDIGRTPVIISEQIEFVNQSKWQADKKIASKFLDDWRADLESHNSNRMLSNYSRNFKSMQGENLTIWFPKLQQSMQNWLDVTVRLHDITQFRYPGKDELIVSTFTQETTSGKSKTSIRKRQYWMKEASKWRIVYEAQI